MKEGSVQQAITPLRLIFWGGLLCIFDITFGQTTNGEGFRIDILNDVVGAVLIAIGVSRLKAIEVHARYAMVMRFVFVTSILAIIGAIFDQFILQLPPPILLVLDVFGFVGLLATAAFCVAMRWFCEQAGLATVAQSWSITTRLFAVLFLVPLGLVYLASAAALAFGSVLNFNLGLPGLLLLPVFVVPIAHLFVSTSRMKREAEKQSASLIATSF